MTPSAFPLFDGKPVTRTFSRLLWDCRKNGWNGTLTSGKRSVAQQTKLYLAYVSKLKTGKPTWANPADPPWKSTHCKLGWHCAVDVTKADEFVSVARQRGWPVSRIHIAEPWHVELFRKPVNTQVDHGPH